MKRGLKVFEASIKVKLILTSILFLTVPLIILGIVSYQKSSQSLDELGKINLQNSVEHTLELMASLNEQVEQGNISLEEAQERVKVAILGEMQEGIRPINTSFNLGENGYLFITDYEGTSVAHPTIEGDNSWDVEDTKGNKFVQAYLNEGINGGGFTYYDYFLPNTETNAEKVNYTKAFPEWEWVVGAGTYMIDFNQSAQSILNVIYIVITVTLFVGIIIIWMFANNISHPIRTVTEHMNYLEKGDLSQDEIITKSKDETGKLSRGLNEMQKGLREMILNLTRTSQTITEQSASLTQASYEVREGSEQVATTMQELASGAENQAHHANELSSMIGTFVLKLQEVNENGEQIQDSTDHVIQLTEKGRELMGISTKQMETIDNMVHDSVEKVEGLDVHTQEISELVSVIHDIAEQTNLLALNAAIEAARAGEQGQGFAVVADEVRKLAEESSASVTNITDIVARIQAESSHVVASLQEGYQDVTEGSNYITTTGETFSQISTAVSEMVEKIKVGSEGLAKIVADSREMNRFIEDIAAISEQSAAGIEETTATTEQTNSAMQEVASSSEKLSHLAEELNHLTKQFKLS